MILSGKRNEVLLDKKYRKLIYWIQRKYKNLLHDIGFKKSIKIKSFIINIDDEKSIRIRSRSHSPLDLKKIKEFIDKNLINNIISESDSSWNISFILIIKSNDKI